MHKAIAAIGVACVVVGLVFTLIPFVNGPSQVLSRSQPDAAFNATGTISLTGAWAIGVSWTSNQPVSLLVVICRSVNLSAPTLQSVCPGAAFSVLNGTSGMGTFSVPIGGTLLFGIVSNASQALRVHVLLKPTLALLGTILVLGGVGILTVGVWPRRKVSAPRTSPGAPPLDPPT